MIFLIRCFYSLSCLILRLYATHCGLGFESWSTFYETVFKNYQNLRKQSIIVVKRREEEPKWGKEHSLKSRATKYNVCGCKEYDAAHKAITVSNWGGVNQQYFMSSPGLLFGLENESLFEGTEHSSVWNESPHTEKQIYHIQFVIVQYSWRTSYKLFELCWRENIINFLLKFCTFFHITIT